MNRQRKHKIQIRRYAWVAALALIGLLGLLAGSAGAQPTPGISFEPKRITAGTRFNMSVFASGAIFTTATTVRLVGFGLLPVTLVNDTALTAAVPETVPAGTYPVEASDPVFGVLTAPDSLVVAALPPTPLPPVPTSEPPPTPLPPTPIPGAPSLLVRSFNPSPGTIAPGGRVTFTFDVFNQGSRTAEGVSVTVDPGGRFVPAAGQGAILLPNLGVGATTVTSLTVEAARDITAGPQTVTITFTYRDFSGESYTSKAALTVNVQTIPQASQVSIARYMVDPNPVAPGQPVTLTVLLTNTGNRTATQVLMRVGGDSSLLLAGPRGDSFPVGDLAPGASASVDLPLVVSTAAKAGPQPQPVTITYLQDTEAQTVQTSITIAVAQVAAPAPVMVLENYTTGEAFLRPGQQFNLSLTLRNVGEAEATGLLVTFGTVDPPSGSGSGNGDSGSGSTTTPSSTFAPLGSGGTQFLGDVAAEGGQVQFSQDFIVTGSVSSGIYSLPITLRYQKPDGSTAQDNLRASLVVVVPPTLRISLQGPLPETINVGEPIIVGLDILNQGRNAVNFSTGVVTAEGGDVMEGAETLIGPLRADEESSVAGTVIPSAAGTVTITVTLNYLDELNQPQTIVNTYTVEAVEPPPPIDMGPPIDFVPAPTEPPAPENDFLGRLLLGLLGLGS